MRDAYVYDCECYLNIFTCAIQHVATGQRWMFEISTRINQGVQFYGFLQSLANLNATMVGFNNVGYDYPLLHLIAQNTGFISADIINAKSREIIASDDRFAHAVWDRDRVVHQTDLFLIHHFDNPQRRTSLKQLEFAMRTPTLQDLPYDPLQPVPDDGFDDLIEYNWNDVQETVRFYKETLEDIAFRDELSGRLGKDTTNWNDTKIGEQIFIQRIEAVAPGSCYDTDGNRKGTPRNQIHLKDCIFPYIQFQSPDFQQIHQWLLNQTITRTKGFFKNLKVNHDGMDYVFGLGGIHASRNWATYRSTDTHMILDLDVTSYYPSLAIVNRVKPEHLPEVFADVYADLKKERVQYAKGTTLNAALKLALNGSYGKSNSPYSPLYDPQFTMTITLNGQLLLCMLAEQMTSIPGIQVIQVNTDGLTLHLPRDRYDDVDRVRKQWEAFTCLDLEEAEYQTMWIRDVNNYLAQYTNGKMKRKGAYEYDPPSWAQKHDYPIVGQAVEACLRDGVPIEKTIKECTNIYDFCKFVKVPRGSRLIIEDKYGLVQTPVQSNTRYYVAKSNDVLIKIMPPLPSKPGSDERRFEVEATRYVNVCNDMADVKELVDYEYYLKEAEKLVLPLQLGELNGTP